MLWGWPHCVQDAELTQLAIDRRLTMIAWEAMNHWTRDGAFSLHVFHKNNELAGYCSVLHALQLRGTSGHFGLRLRAAVISFGATARGAVAALLALGVHDVTVLTHRSVPAVASPMPPARLVHYDRDDADPARRPELVQPERGSLAEYLAQHDIVVNCILQDTDDPLMFVTNDDLDLFQRGSLIVDVSCDEGMGFEWARPTSFDEPMFTVGPGVHYYAVDHSPTYLWNSATWEISEALIPHLRRRHVGARRLGGAARRSAARSRSETASSRTPASSPSRTASRSTRTGRGELTPSAGPQRRRRDGRCCTCTRRAANVACWRGSGGASSPARLGVVMWMPTRGRRWSRTFCSASSAVSASVDRTVDEPLW